MEDKIVGNRVWLSLSSAPLGFSGKTELSSLFPEKYHDHQILFRQSGLNLFNGVDEEGLSGPVLSEQRGQV